MKRRTNSTFFTFVDGVAVTRVAINVIRLIVKRTSSHTSEVRLYDLSHTATRLLVSISTVPSGLSALRTTYADSKPNPVSLS